MKNYNAILCDTDDIIAEDTNETRHQKMTRKVKDKSGSGDATGCTKMAAGKLTFFVKPSQDITERFEHYRIRYPDAKIVK
jgi:hypothetical protein